MEVMPRILRKQSPPGPVRRSQPKPEESYWQRERKELLTKASIACVQQFAQRSWFATSKNDPSKKRLTSWARPLVLSKLVFSMHDECYAVG